MGYNNKIKEIPPVILKKKFPDGIELGFKRLEEK